MAAPIDGQTCHPIIPLVKPCSSTALRSYPSAYPSRLGSVIGNHFNCGGMIFFLWCLALHGVSYSRQSPWYLQAPPLRPAPHTASRSYPEDYICHNNVILQVLATCSNLCLPGFLFLILFRGNLSCYIQNRKFNLSLMNLFILVWKNYYPLLFVVTFLNLNKWTVCFVLNVMTVQILSRQNFFSLMMNFNGEDI